MAKWSQDDSIALVIIFLAVGLMWDQLDSLAVKFYSAASLCLLWYSGFFSIIFGALLALIPIFAFRLAIPYTAGAIAVFSGVCGTAEILVDSNNVGVLRTMLYFFFACISSYTTASFLRSKPPTMHGVLARVSAALVLAGAIASFELAFTPSLEFLANYWALQRLTFPLDLWTVLGSTFYPSTLVTRSWSLMHSSCFSVFATATQVTNAIFLLCFLAGLLGLERGLATVGEGNNVEEGDTVGEKVA
jgi:hypothetical protein